jgi:hypothetical protein
MPLPLRLGGKECRKDLIHLQDLVAPLPTVRPTIFCSFVRRPSSARFRVLPNGNTCLSARHK